MGGSGHQAEVSSGSGGGIAQTIAGGCGSPGSGPSSGSGSSNGGEVVAASGGRNADSPAYSCGFIMISPRVAADRRRAENSDRISCKIRPQDPGGGGGGNTDSCSPGCSGYGNYELIRVNRHGASVGALTDFGGVGRGGQG